MAIPERIEELAHKVRTEIYGRDVREALATSMEATAEVAEWSRQVAQNILDGKFDEGELNTEIERKLNDLERRYAPDLGNLKNEVGNARGKEQSLGGRLNLIDQDLAQRVTNTEFESAIAAVVDGGPGIIKNTLAELEADYPNGASAVALVLETDPAHIYVWINDAWKDAGEYQGIELKKRSVTSDKLVDRLVGYQHLNFSDGKELFNGDWVIDYFISATDYKFKEGTDTNGGRGAISIIVKIEPNKQYDIRKGESNRFRIATFRHYPVNDTAPLHAFINDKENQYMLTPAENANYLVIQVSGDSETPSLSIREYDLKVSIETLGFTTRKNIFNGRFDYFSIFNPNGHLRTVNPNSPTARGYAFPITEGETYYIRVFEQTQRFRLATYKRIRENEFPVRYIIDDDNLKEYSFTANNGETFAYIQVSGQSAEPDMAITTGGYSDDSRTSPLIPSSLIDITDFKTSLPIKLSGDFNTLYISDETKDVSGASDNPLINTVTDDVYGWYNDLMDDYPDIVTNKKRWGYATASDGTEDASLPLYEYTIGVPRNSNMTERHEDVGETEFITVLVTTGVHGTEKNTVWSLYNFMKQMLDHRKNNDFLASIQANVQFKIIPVVNPGGYNANTYENARGVNINTNFSDNWENTGTGTSAYSEYETQAIGRWFEENKDAHVYIDYHAFGYSAGQNQVSYHYSHNKDLNNMYASLIRRMSSSWKDRLFPDYGENESLGYNNPSFYDRPNASREAYRTYGIKNSGLIEMRYNLPESGIARYARPLVEGGVELFANYLANLISRYYT
ncbi:M14 family zinc carboxypeptidase [Oceanobacillus indicireducens]|uniref:Peptidase M14 domain-containing protein n=1 Tax=Oceanobacillus indicireducens TaxID=1004261 RepID=A0A917XW33_9BACI|nr:M14 family zinc carboxypeptidase [Oceanobacillus indicireducens]GGN54811.1 hypothetical protein GCM10007971_12970 [Oceanobacillus indicireducens]